MKKAIQYAYPTSVTAEYLGHGKDGCYYVTMHGTDPLRLKAKIISHAVKLRDCLEEAKKIDANWFVYCGKILNGEK
jgi:hypothetical protein